MWNGIKHKLYFISGAKCIFEHDKFIIITILYCGFVVHITDTRAQKVVSYTSARITQTVFAHDQHWSEQNTLSSPQLYRHSQEQKNGYPYSSALHIHNRWIYHAIVDQVWIYHAIMRLFLTIASTAARNGSNVIAMPCIHLRFWTVASAINMLSMCM